MATVLDLVRHYQHAIEKYPNDEQKVLKSIDKLFNLDVTVQHLQDTGVGRTVNALRKEAGDVGHAARALVNKWKLMVAAEESDQDGDHNTDTTTYNGHENGKDSDDNAKQNSRNNKCDRYEKSTPTVKTEPNQSNGNYSGVKRKHQSSEDEEPDIKKSRTSSGHSGNHDDNRSKTSVQVKREPESEDESESERSHSEDSDSDGSESSREVDKQIKQEPTNNHKSSSLKESSSSHKHSRDHHRESSSSKTTHESERHSRKHHSSERERHSSEKSSSKEKSHSSHKHKSSKSNDRTDKNSKPEGSSSEKDKKHKEDSKSSSKHKSSFDKHKSESSSEKNKNHHEKHSSKSEKHKSSSHSEKPEKSKHKSSSDKDVADDKQKSKHSSSSKEKHSSSSREISKDRSSSTKEKTDGSKEGHHSHKSEKKTSSSDSKSRHSDSRHKSDKHDEESNDSKSKHKSSSSSSHKSKSSSKSKEDVPKKKTRTSSSADSDDGIDCGSGASFAEALGMVSPAKPKKKPIPVKEALAQPSMGKDLSPASLLAPTAKLAPLPALPEISALPDISPNYKPRPPPKLMPHFTDDDALSSVISSKNQRTKVYSGNKVIGKIPTLYEMCVQILQEHIDALEYTGGVPYDILKPVVDRATPQQLFVLEHYNPYLMEDTDHLWEKFCQKNFRNKQRQEMETWREMYMRCQEEQEHRLKSLTANIRMTQEAKKAPIKQTKMAYVDSVVKPPRNIARKQAQHGTAHAAAGSPAARVAALAGGPHLLRGAARPAPAAPAAAAARPKKAPLMQKALQFMRGRKR